MKKRLLALVLVLALALSLGLAGCAKDPVDTPPVDTDQPSTAGKDTLVFSISSDIDNFDPYSNQATTFIKTLGYNCYEPLLHIGPDMEYVPDLAESWEHPDDLTYIFKLREGVKFHNGNDLTAEDVKFSIEHAMDPDVGSWLGAFFTCVDEITAEGSTVTIKLKDVSNTFLDDISMLRIINKGTEGSLKQTPIGTGAFKLVSYVPNDSITLEKFADYWDAASVKLNKVILRPIPDKKIQLTNLASGDVDIVEELLTSELENIESNSDLQVITAKSSNSILQIEVGRHNFEPFSKPEVMQAMDTALDRETINETVCKGLGNVLKSPYPTGAKYYKEADQNTYDLEKAKQMLADAGYPDGFEFDLMIANGYPNWEKLAIIYQASLQQIGVKMNVKKVEFSEWLDAYLNRTYDMIINEYPMAGTDPATYNNIILAGLFDYQCKDIPKLQDLIAQGKAEGDDAKRAEIYSEIQDIMVKYMPVMGVITAPGLYAASANLKGFEVNPVGHTFFKAAYFA